MEWTWQDNSWQETNSWPETNSCSWQETNSWSWQGGDSWPEDDSWQESWRDSGSGQQSGASSSWQRQDDSASSRRDGSRGHGSLENLNARNRREIKRWRDDKSELERARYTIQQQEDLIDILRGTLWCEEDKTEELTERAASLKSTMLEMADTIQEMSGQVEEMSGQVEELRAQSVESMRERMKAEEKVSQLQRELRRLRSESTLEMGAKDRELKDLQAQLEEHSAVQRERHESLCADFKRYQAGQHASTSCVGLSRL